MPLLEREEALADLDGALAAAQRGRGRVAVVSGGAGLGKTSVVRAFLAGLDSDVVVREGACDDLLTPRPLGPVHDLGRQAGPALARALAEGDVQAVFTALLDELASRAVTVVVVEDVHWADDASLDALAFLTRRIERLPALLVLTYRDDDVPVEAPLHRVLGGLRTPAAVRIQLAPLSADAVMRLAGHPEAGRRVHASTGGNPFFVSELLAAEHEGTPASVSHAVLARVARLPSPTRALLDLLAVVPARTEATLLDVLCPGWPERAAAAEERGVVEWQGDGLAFRHELARRAVEEALPASRARGLHAQVLAALRASGADPARLVHHAERAADLDTLAEVAPLAARAAAAAGAHREATAHYRRALELGDRYPDAERADLLEAFTLEASTTCHIGEALQAAERALALREARGEPSGIGRNLRRLSQLSWLRGRRDDMERRLAAALEVLEDQPPGPERAMAYSDLALRIGLYGGRREEAARTADRAVALAKDCADPAALGHVQGRIGLLNALLDADDALLRDCLERARTAGLHLDAGMAYQGLATGAALRRDRAARRWIDEGIDYLQSRDVLGPLQYLRGLQAAHDLADGDWRGAHRRAGWVLAQPEGRGITGVHALQTEALLHLRRGRLPQAVPVLGELWTVAETCGMVQHVAPAACALAEHAELTGEWADVVVPLQEARALAQRLGLAQVASELGFWLVRAGALDPAGTGAPEPEDPYALAAAGEWRAAAAMWERSGCPFERAHALADSDEEQALLTALDLAVGLGADPLAARIRAKLRASGVQRVPRGPRAETRSNPAGLTARQLEVLSLLREGLTDAEIATRLVLSVKTVNHHVSAVLDKLGVDNRRAAVRVTARNG
ncbi:AAA family ATPase [Pseudonocardia kujensis]|uniref:ATP-binding protein n=1 Tax=Pseudonocardia kujensis TaxID=1128675 RepID=UPI001E405028|nr:AAA family ATPase [Pseudonocardia kujensis]MCE0765413.1 AAA family ATPase [Pseudonocardia kujensis]